MFALKYVLLQIQQQLRTATLVTYSFSINHMAYGGQKFRELSNKPGTCKGRQLIRKSHAESWSRNIQK